MKRLIFTYYFIAGVLAIGVDVFGQPAAPSNLVAIKVSTSQINLTWLDNSTNEFGFTIQRKIGAGGSYSEIDTVTANVRSYSSIGLVANTHYFYRVRAYGTGGSSAFSNEADAVTLPFPPSPPVDLAATSVSSSQIDLTWKSNGGNIKIERKTGIGGTYSQINTVAGPDSVAFMSYSDNGLAANTNHFYRVRAYNDGGNSAYSNEADATTLENLPAAPLSLTATAISTSQINLAWQDNATNEVGFKIERKIGVGGTYGQIDSVTANVTSYSNIGLTANTSYFYRVRAYNTVGSSAYSNEADTKTLPNPPAAPSSLTATTVSSSQIDLMWQDNSTDEDGFKIERKIGAGGTYSQIAAVAANVMIYSSTGLAAGTNYFYRMRAFNPGGNSAYSNEDDATTLDNIPAAPSNLVATAVSSSQINLAWQDNSTNEVGFKIERKTGVGGTYAQIDSVTANVTSYSNTGLAASTTYFYRVRAYDTAAANSAYSNESNATTFNPAPTVTSISPTSGSRLQTLDVVFTGTNFISGVTSVIDESGHITINSTTVNSSTNLTANLTITATADTGTLGFLVANSSPGGGTTSSPLFTVNNPPPTLVSLSPTNGNRLQTLDVVFTGTSFIDGVTSVNVGSGITVNSMAVNSSTSLTANLTIAAGAATGARNFSVTNSGPGGGTSGTQPFTVNNPLPTLTSLLPTFGFRFNTLDVFFTGTNFIDGVSSVNFGADITLNSTTVNSPTQITANITIGANAVMGPRSVPVINSGPGGGASGNQTFTVGDNPAPTLTGISPNSGNRLQTLDVVFTGTNFFAGITFLTVGGGITVNSTTVNSSTSLTANLTINAPGAGTGPRNFSVTNIAPGGGTSANQTFTVNEPLPTLTSIAPTNGNRFQTLDVVFTGTNFINGVTSVNVGSGISINSTTINSSASLTANLTIAAGAATGQRDFSVTNSAPGGGTSANQIFIVNNPLPTLTSLSPSPTNGNRLQTLDVVFAGTNFINGVTSVNVGSGITVNSTDVISSSLLTANLTIAAGAATGQRNFSVTNIAPGGGTSENQIFTVNNPPPTLVSLSPTNGNRLQTLDVVFAGTNFINGVSLVSVFGSGITVNSTTVNSSTSLTANLTIAAGAATGQRNFSVINIVPGGGVSANQTFTVNNPVPTLASLAPANGNRLQTLDVIFTGTNFISGVSSVNFGADITLNSTTVNSATQITTNITIGGSAALGARDVPVTNSGPGGGTSANQTFTVGNNPAPTLTSITPINGNRLQTLDVVFTGTNFIDGVSSVNVGTGITVNSTAVNSSTSLTANLTIAAGAVIGSRSFFVTNSAPGGGTSANQTFTVNNPVPTVTSISPASGNRLQTLDVVVTGTNFIDGASSVNLFVGADININSIVVNSATQITANITIFPFTPLVPRDVSVINAAPGGGTATLTNGFTVNNPAPTLTSIALTSGNRLQTLDVVFTGTNFVIGSPLDAGGIRGTSVNVGSGITVNSTTINSSTSLTANLTITAGAATGPRNFSVTNIAPGGGTSANQTFTVNNPVPTVTSISPASGNRLQTLDVVITGTNFIDGVSSVFLQLFGGIEFVFNSVVVNSATQITTNITILSFAPLGPRDVSVTNVAPGGGTATLTNGFTVAGNPVPTLTSISPTSGGRLQTLEVILTGTNFISGVSSVGFGADITVDSTIVNSVTQITANITIGANAALGSRNVSVINAAPGGGTVVFANGFTVGSNPAPTLTSISPINGNRLQTLDVVFTGTNFIAGVTDVNVGSGITVNSTTVNSLTSLTANLIITAAAATGARNFSVINSAPGGGTSTNQTFTVNNPVPTLASIAPITGNRLQTLEVVFTGTNFIDGVSSVNVGNGITVNSTTVTSSTSLTANLTVTAAAATGARIFSVVNSGPGGGTSGNRTFTVNNPAPALTNVAPASGNRLQTLDVVFTGTNFISGVSSVSFGAGITLNSTIVNPANGGTTQITANITISSNAAIGARSVSVTNAPPGGAAAILPNGFTVGGNPAPTLAGIAPINGIRLQTLEVIFTGTNFISGVTTVNAGTGITINSTTVNSSTSLTANVTITASAATGARDFSVVNSAPGGGTSANQTFAVENPAPAVTSISPNSGNRLQTLEVVFTGTNFISGATTLNAGSGITVNSTRVNNSTSLTANLTITDSAATGARNFSVTNSSPGGGTSANQTFTVNNPAPTLISLSPPNGNRLQTLEVVFAGTNFITGASSVSFGADITVNSAMVNPANGGTTQITANITLSANATFGARNVSVSNALPGGGTATLPNGFTVGSNPAPTLTSLSPPTGNRLQTLEVIFTGRNFINDVSTVNLGEDITVNSMVVNPASGGTAQITANLTIGSNAALGVRDVLVINAPPGGGTATLPNGFTVGSNPAPTLASIAPNNGSRLQTFNVVLTGTNFISEVTTVNAGAGITVNSTTVHSSTSLTANLTINAGAATGARNFSVRNSEPGGGTSANRTFTVNNPAPTLTSLSPPTGSRLQTLDMILTGTNFISGVSTVNLGADVTVNSAIVNPANGGTTQITANITMSANATFGARDVSVSNALPGGGTATLPNGFTVGSNPAPTLASIAPITGRRLQTLEVVFTGTNFISGVTFVSAGAGITVNAATVTSSTSLTANLTITAAAATGARSFAVINSGPGGGTSANRTFTVQNPAPTLTNVAPTNGNRLQTLDVVFTGTNFIDGVSSVNFGAAITVNSIAVNPANGGTTQITANITISSNTVLGARNVSVTNAPPGGGTTILTNGFIIGNNPAPTLASLSPNNGDRLQTLEVIFTGTNFISGVSSVNFGAGITLNSTTVNSPTQITANITIGSNAVSGGRDVSITNAPPGGGTATLTNGFTVGNNTAPTLTGISPINGNRLQTLDVIFTGTNFISDITAVNAGSGITVNSTAVNSPTSLTANLTIAASAATGERNFSVTNTGGGSSANQTFTVNNPVPTLASLTPATGNQLQTLEAVLTGTNFIDGVSSVSFGADITVNLATVNSATQITANLTIGADAAAGPRNVAITNAPPGGGITTLTNGFTVNGDQAPTLTGISPISGDRLQTLDVVFTGTNFISGITAVNAGSSIMVNSMTINNSTSLTANLTITASAATGERNFSVTNIGASSGTSANQTFTVNNPVPTLTSLTPATGNQLQTLEVILTGTNFIDGVSSVSFGADIMVNAITVNPANGGTTQITANITIDADAAAGPRNVAITNTPPGGGITTLTNGFTVNGDPVPTLTGISPISGNRLQRLDVIFTGTNFISAITAVNAGSGITVNSTAVNSANGGTTSLTANLTITASAATGERNFSVTNIGASSGTSANQTFTVNNPVPTLASLTPATGNRLQTLEVLLTGTNFISGVTAVNVGSGITVNSTTVNSPTSLAANLTITASAATAERNFSVANIGPGGGTSGNQTFTVGNLPSTPLPPSNLIAEAMSMSQINLRWTDNSNNEAGFKIVRRVGTIVPEMSLFTVGPNVQNYQDAGLNQGAATSYQVFAFNAGGDSPPSNFSGETTATGVRCDVTRNFTVDASDVDFEMRLILQNPVKRATHLDSTLADTNLDGRINVIDVVDIVNESLKNLLAATASPRENNGAEAGGELRLGAAEIIVGATIKLPLTISVAEPVTALQLRIRGDSRALGLGDPVLSAGNHGMTLATARGPDQLAVLIYSLSGDCITPGTRELLQFSLQARSADFSKTGLQIESALLVGKSGTPIPVRISSDAANLKINLPDKFVLSQNYPNPFDAGAANPQTEIVYTIPAAAAVKLAVYNVLGHEVALLVNSWQTPGFKKVIWNGRDRQGKRVTAGVYFYRLEAGDFVSRQKMVLK